MVTSARLEVPTVRLLVCEIAWTEAASAIAAKERAKEITRNDADYLLKRIENDFTGEVRPYVILDIGMSIVRDAAAYTRTHRLKSQDAMHLAAAVAAMYSAPPGIEFLMATADARLSGAARTENIPVLELEPWTPGWRPAHHVPAE
jgi:predicted nucleic acid-binding protein